MMNDVELTRVIQHHDARAKREKTCQWFALCKEKVECLRAHPVLGNVPVCDRHARLNNPSYEGLTYLD